MSAILVIILENRDHKVREGLKVMMEYQVGRDVKGKMEHKVDKGKMEFKGHVGKLVLQVKRVILARMVNKDRRVSVESKDYPEYLVLRVTEVTKGRRELKVSKEYKDLLARKERRATKGRKVIRERREIKVRKVTRGYLV